MSESHGKSPSQLLFIRCFFMVSAAFCNQILFNGFSDCNGVFLGFLTDHFEDAAKASFIIAAHSSVLQFGGFLSSFVCENFGFRRCMILGSVLTFFGYFVSSFLNSYASMGILYSLIAGLGNVFVNLPSLVIVPMHFPNNVRVLNSVVSCGAGFGVLIFPPVMQYLLEMYYWQGMFIIISGLMLNGIVFSLFVSEPLDETICSWDTSEINEPTITAMTEGITFNFYASPTQESILNVRSGPQIIEYISKVQSSPYSSFVKLPAMYKMSIAMAKRCSIRPFKFHERSSTLLEPKQVCLIKKRSSSIKSPQHSSSSSTQRFSSIYSTSCSSLERELCQTQVDLDALRSSTGGPSFARMSLARPSMARYSLAASRYSMANTGWKYSSSSSLSSLVAPNRALTIAGAIIRLLTDFFSAGSKFSYHYLHVRQVLSNADFYLVFLAHFLKNYSSYQFTQSLPSVVHSKGMESTWLMSGIGAMEVTGILVNLAFGFNPRISSVLIFSVSAMMMSVVIVVFPHCNSFRGFMIASCVYGFLFGLLQSNEISTSFELFSLDQLTITTGMLMVAGGMGSLVGLPLSTFFEKNNLQTLSYNLNGVASFNSGVLILFCYCRMIRDAADVVEG